MQPVISLKNVSIFASPALDMPVLRGVNMAVEPSELIYLVGKVGSGKSSLLKTLYAESPLRAGQASVCGYDLERLSRSNFHNFRRTVGIVFQEYNLLPEFTVYKNLEFVLRATDWKKRAEIDNRIMETLELIGMSDKADKRPVEISGGERQHICIARALLNSPKLILADEPTGNLDPTTAADIINLFRTIADTNDCSVVISTHNSENLRLFPARVLRCNEGFVEEI